MSYTVRGFDISQINLAPATVLEEVLQNVAIILSTHKGSNPLARDIGLPRNFVDKPVSIARTLCVAEIMEAVPEQEPRAEVAGVTFEADESVPDKLIPIVEVNVIE